MNRSKQIQVLKRAQKIVETQHRRDIVSALTEASEEYSLDFWGWEELVGLDDGPVGKTLEEMGWVFLESFSDRASDIEVAEFFDKAILKLVAEEVD